MREALRLLRAGVASDSVLRVITSLAIDSASQDRGEQRATAAFLAVAKTGDVPNRPWLTVRIVGIEKGDKVNAVEVLESRLALWRKNGGAALHITNETVRP